MGFRLTREAVASPLEKATLGAAAIVGVALFVGALLFSNSFAAHQVADDAVVLYRAEATLGATEIALKALSQAVLLSEDVELGVADVESANTARGEARRALDQLESSASELIEELEESGALEQIAAAALVEGDTVLNHLSENDPATASALLAGETRNEFETLRDVVTLQRDESATAVSSSTDLLSRIGNLPAFLVAFLIPGLAILAYRRIARNQLRLAEVQLEARLQSERKLVEAKDEFVANISHELRTPLTSIYGFSELLIEQGIVDPEQTMELISVINAESAELHRMVEDLLASARNEAGTLALDIGDVDLSKELQAARTGVMLAGKALSVDLEAPQVWADAVRVRHILRNLLSNACRYGGERVLVGSELVDGDVEITVADDGEGVSKEKTTRLFTRYVHEGTDPLTVGSIGLGLAVVKTLAQAMAGSVTYTRQNGWSHFTVRLPVSEVASGTEDGTEAPSGSLPLHLAATARSPGDTDHAA